MKKGKIILISILSIVIIIISLIFVILFTNKTFFKTTYIGVQKQEIFYSLRSEKSLKEEISNYMSDFEYFEDDSTYGYKKDDLFIQSYNVIDNGLYRKIVIIY